LLMYVYISVSWLIFFAVSDTNKLCSRTQIL
jgi:hypothetical protein